MSHVARVQRSSSEAAVLCRTDDVLGEGPLWDHRSNSLLWIDIFRGRVHRWSEGEGARVILEMDALIGAVALAGAADLLLATSKGLLRWQARSREVLLLANPIQGRPVRFNDGRVDPLGRFWVGTMSLDPAHYDDPWGELYRYDPDGTIHRMEEGLTISNGLDWSPDGKTFYLTDTMRRVIYAYDFAPRSGTISNRRTLIQTVEEDGYPDGLVVDREGTLWSVGFGASVICRYDDRGRHLERLTMPVSCPTSLTFGGCHFSTAFITTSKHLLPVNHSEALAGGLLSLELRAQGRPVVIFGAPPASGGGR